MCHHCATLIEAPDEWRPDRDRVTAHQFWTCLRCGARRIERFVRQPRTGKHVLVETQLERAPSPTN